MIGNPTEKVNMAFKLQTDPNSFSRTTMGLIMNQWAPNRVDGSRANLVLNLGVKYAIAQCSKLFKAMY